MNDQNQDKHFKNISTSAALDFEQIQIKPVKDISPTLRIQVNCRDSDYKNSTV
jgi:hypothetical protein